MGALARYQRRSRRSAALGSVPGRLAARALGGAAPPARCLLRANTHASAASRLPHARSVFAAVQAACALVGQPAALPRARARSCCQRSNDAAEVVATVLRASVGAARARRRTRASTCTSLGWTWGSASRRTRARQSSPACTTAALSSAPTRESQQARVALRTRVYTQRARFPGGRTAAVVFLPSSREGPPRDRELSRGVARTRRSPSTVPHAAAAASAQARTSATACQTRSRRSPTTPSSAAPALLPTHSWCPTTARATRARAAPLCTACATWGARTHVPGPVTSRAPASAALQHTTTLRRERTTSYPPAPAGRASVATLPPGRLRLPCACLPRLWSSATAPHGPSARVAS